MPHMGEEGTREDQAAVGNTGGTDPGMDLGSSGWVSTAVAAAGLGISPRRVRTLIKNGELEAVADGEGVNKVYSVSIASLERLRDRRASGGSPRGIYRDSSPAEPTAGNSAEQMADVIRELAGRLETRAASESELRTRLELTAKAESTLREELARERKRAEAERERADRLEAELREVRKPPPDPRDPPETASEGTDRGEVPPEPQETLQRRSWWRRFFGFD